MRGAGPRVLFARATLGYQDGATSELPSASPPSPAALHLQAPRPDPFAELGVVPVFAIISMRPIWNSVPGA